MFTSGVDQPGGAAKHTRVLAEGLAERGHNVTVLSRDSSAFLLRLDRSAAGVSYFAIGDLGIARLGAIVYLGVAVAIGIARGRGRASYVGLELASPSVAAALSGLPTRSPYLCFTFSSGERGELELLTGRHTWAVRRALLNRAAAIVTQTPFAAREVREVLGGPEVTVLPTPVEEVGAAEPLTGAPSVLFTGRLTEQKGLDTLIAAWSEVVERVPGAQLTIAGQGRGYGGAWASIDDELRATVAADERLQTSVALPGWVRDVPGLMAGRDVYVLPSRSEGMSNALLEACAHGRIVVASDIEANVTVLGEDYPLLFPVNDDAALADRLTTALQDAEVRERAREWVRRSVRPSLRPIVIGRLEEILG